MTNYKLNLEKVTKIFGRRLIFKDIDCEFTSGSVFGLAGRNGSGKSTLAKIIVGIISTTSGKVNHFINGIVVPNENLYEQIGFVSPYLVLYDEFTAYENIIHFLKIRGLTINNDTIDYWFNEFELFDRRNDLLKGFSSGMKQRMKFIFSLIHQPQLLLFDEPTSNLDNNGKDKVYEIIKTKLSDRLVIIASNEDNDLAICNKILTIENYKEIK
ncbi:MAG: ABC transporter ATP-binding protein [Ignavibacteriales bacterium CG_4_9_14_3_um_filter_34_10]|nr:MAG: ABC transporter ATP-binding protein [Ignavibacteriales bacterium CG_4_9_14_3_um_filter_34_10]